MKLRIVALASALLLTAACSSGTPTEPAGLPSTPIPNNPDYTDLPIPPRP